MNNKFHDCEQHNTTVWLGKIKKYRSLILLSSQKGKKLQKKTKIYLLFIWIKKIPLVQVYFSHFIAKQSTISKVTYFKQGTRFCSACSSISLISYETGQLEDKYHAPIMSLLLFTMNFYCIFFRIKFSKKLFVCFLHSGVRKSGFSERCSLMSGILQGLVKICEKIWN